MSLVFDHLVVSATKLEDGVKALESKFGVRFEQGGQHARYGTHNALLGLEGGIYLEVIAIDPDAEPEVRPRWFGLDGFEGQVRLTNWVCGGHDLKSLLPELPNGFAQIVGLTRGDLAWDMAEAAGGILPYDQCFPGLIDWRASQHPSERLQPTGITLERLVLEHPEAQGLQAALAKFIADARLRVVPAAIANLRADLRLPNGKVVSL